MEASTKRKAVLIVAGLGVSALLLAAAVQGPFRRSVELELKPGTLPYLAKELKEQGIKRHDLGVPYIPEYPDLAEGLDQLVAEADAVVVGTLLGQRYRMSVDLERIETIAKFRVDEFLSGTLLRARQLIPASRMPPGARSLAPLKEDEILVLRGGVLMVDGVLLRQGAYGFPAFEIGRQYILFLTLKEPIPQCRNHYGDQNVRLYLLSLGPHSVFLTEGLDTFPIKLRAIGLGPYFKEELEQRFFSRKDFFVDHIRRTGRAPQIRWLEER